MVDLELKVPSFRLTEGTVLDQDKLLTGTLSNIKIEKTLNTVQHRKYPLFTHIKRYIYKKMHVLFFELDLDKVARNVTQHPPHHVTYAPVTFEVASSNDLGTDVLEKIFYYKVARNVAQCLALLPV